MKSTVKIGPLTKVTKFYLGCLFLDSLTHANKNGFPKETLGTQISNPFYPLHSFKKSSLFFFFFLLFGNHPFPLLQIQSRKFLWGPIPKQLNTLLDHMAHVSLCKFQRLYSTFILRVWEARVKAPPPRLFLMV